MDTNKINEIVDNLTNYFRWTINRYISGTWYADNHYLNLLSGYNNLDFPTITMEELKQALQVIKLRVAIGEKLW